MWAGERGRTKLCIVFANYALCSPTVHSFCNPKIASSCVHHVHGVNNILHSVYKLHIVSANCAQCRQTVNSTDKLH